MIDIKDICIIQVNILYFIFKKIGVKHIFSTFRKGGAKTYFPPLEKVEPKLIFHL
jgi:hypothetical protein